MRDKMIYVFSILLLLVSVGQIRLYWILKKYFFLILGIAGIFLSITIYGYMLQYINPLIPVIIGIIYFIATIPLIVYRRKIKFIYFKKVNPFYKILFPFGIVKHALIPVLKETKETVKGDKFFLVNAILSLPVGIAILIHYDFNVHGYLALGILLIFGIFFLLYYLKTN